MQSPAAPASSITADEELISSDGRLREHANELGGYAFRYPTDWKVSTDGEVSELRSPDDLVLFSFGPSPGGALPDAAAAVAERYADDIHVTDIVSSREDTTEQGFPTWVVGGIGRDAHGPHDRFLAMAVDAPGEDQAIMVRFPSGPAVLDLLPDIEKVISSYRVTSGTV